MDAEIVKYITPRDEFIRTLERAGRGATLKSLARKWGMDILSIKKMYRNENWEALRVEYLQKIGRTIEDKSAKTIAAKLTEINEEADRIFELGMRQAQNFITSKYEFCANPECYAENPDVNPRVTHWTCLICGKINRISLRAQDMQYWTIMTRGIYDSRMRIWGGDKIQAAEAVDRSAFAEHRNRYEWDKLGFAKALFPHLVPDYFCQIHLDSNLQFKELAGARGFNEVIAAPRGYAKTTFDVTIDVIHDCVYGHEKFIIICSSTSSLSLDKVKAIRDEIETNYLLKLIYGDLKGPKWNQDDFVTANGTRVMAISPKTQVRGLNERGNRPTKIILDDAENSEHVQTLLQREKMRKWFYEDIAKLGTKQTNIKMVGTSLHCDALLEEMFKNPGFKSRRYRAVLQFANESAKPLWEEWRNILVDIMNPDRMHMADAFYKEHEAEMIKDSKVLWPERERYVDLMKMRLFEGDTAFQLEKMNNPLSEDRLIFNMEDAGKFNIGIGRILRDDGRVVDFMDLEDRIAAFYDPVVGQGTESDFAACTIIGKDKYGFKYVLDCYLKQFAPPNEQIQSVVDLLWKWKVTRFGIEANGFQSLLVTGLKELIAKKILDNRIEWPIKLIPVTNLRSKHVRISTMELAVANKWIWFNNDLPAQYFEQFRRFRPVPDAGYDDAPDSTEGCVRVLDGNLS